MSVTSDKLTVLAVSASPKYGCCRTGSCNDLCDCRTASPADLRSDSSTDSDVGRSKKPRARVSFGEVEEVEVPRLVLEPVIDRQPSSRKLSFALAQRCLEAGGHKAEVTGHKAAVAVRRREVVEASCFAGLPSRENLAATALCVVGVLGAHVGLTPLALLMAGTVKAKGMARGCTGKKKTASK